MVDIIATAGLLMVFSIIALVFLSGKGGILIAGYNMMPKEEKAKIDTPKLCRCMGKMMLGVCCSVALLLAYLVTRIDVLHTISLGILAVSIITALIWVNVHYMAPVRKNTLNR